MTRAEFISFVAKIAVKDWRERRIMLPSVVIAQACKESAFGTSELAVNAMALFGIKLNGWTGKSYRKKADEQNPDGSMRTDPNTLWRAYDSWEQSILDHSDYIATRKVGNQVEPNFKSIIGETNVKKVIAGLIGNQNRASTALRCTDWELEGYVLTGKTVYPYATGLNYPQSLYDDYIVKYDLLKYDIMEEDTKMLKVAIDAGHYLKTPGKRVTLSDIDPSNTREWSLNDRIADKLEALLKSYDCEILRVDDTTGKTDVSLKNRARKANEWGADVYISIHHNGGIYGGTGGGTVVFYYSSKKERKTQAEALYNAIIANTGLVGNRASKVVKKGYSVLVNTKMPSFLCELGFMDSRTDVPIILTEEYANKSAKGLVDFLVKSFGLKKTGNTSPVVTPKPTAPIDTSFKVRVTANQLNYRAGAGTKYPIKGVIRKGQVYTIVETSGSWGKLKSGAGWICLSYTERI